jgi:hypothetical protein
MKDTSELDEIDAFDSNWDSYSHPYQAIDLARKLKRERDEARAITKEAITGLYNLGDYDLANKLSSKLEGPK